MPEVNQDKLRRIAGHSLQRWVFALADRLSADDAARLTLAAAIAAWTAAHGNEATVEALREAADRLESYAAESRTVN